MKSTVTSRFWRDRSLGARAALSGLACAGIVGASVLGASAASARPQAHAASARALVVWYDAARAAYVQEYKQTHPHANIKWVLYSGDNNGDGTLQSKFSLYNR